MNLRYSGDGLSLLRALLTIPVVIYVTDENWTAALLILGLAWATDLVDGIAAKKWGGLRDQFPSFDADGIADTVLAIGSTGAITYYMGHHYGLNSWEFLVAYLIAGGCVLAGGVMVLLLMIFGETPVTTWHRVIVGGYMIIGHSVFQIGAPLVWLAYMADGADSATATMIVLLCVAALQYQKVLLWRSGRLSPAETK